ncbi:glycoside hydrolase family 108 protein [Chitinibacter tainanensis]|uniref:glycoside hydrolase family 108 protein n=1 Tax=Chitinibacter tainanensis TaxID=230667 RepID=UPI0023557D4C|nr:glycosyl hydrolase 108 family protein [Chitinibacter tainanensis]
MKINDLLDHVVGLEGGYVNDPNDSGGETIWGITIAVAREEGYTGRMQDMTREQAKQIYLKRYWIKPKFADVGARSQAVAAELFDTGVNCGTATAGMMLQRALNVMNNQAAFYPDLKVDGAIGPATLAALDKFLAKRGADGEAVMLKALNCLQGERYIDLAERRQKDEAFIYGWIRNRVVI